MKEHTTNYESTFIAVADDCPVKAAEIPPLKGGKRTVANLQFDLLTEAPYRYTSDELLFKIYAERQQIPEEEIAEARTLFFSKGQPCLRTSPLAKRYGWGIHHDDQGRVALYACESREYKAFSKDKGLRQLKAMKSAR
jgi:hypothetical protein